MVYYIVNRDTMVKTVLILLNVALPWEISDIKGFIIHNLFK